MAGRVSGHSLRVGSVQSLAAAGASGAAGVRTNAPKGVLNPLPDRSIARAKQTVSYPAPIPSGA